MGYRIGWALTQSPAEPATHPSNSNSDPELRPSFSVHNSIPHRLIELHSPELPKNGVYNSDKRFQTQSVRSALFFLECFEMKLRLCYLQTKKGHLSRARSKLLLRVKRTVVFEKVHDSSCQQMALWSQWQMRSHYRYESECNYGCWGKQLSEGRARHHTAAARESLRAPTLTLLGFTARRRWWGWGRDRERPSGSATVLVTNRLQRVSAGLGLIADMSGVVCMRVKKKLLASKNRFCLTVQYWWWCKDAGGGC